MASPEEIWLVDGFNVVQVGLLGGRDRSAWWTAPRRVELMARVDAFDAHRAEIWVAFDGDRPDVLESESGTGARAVFVPCADDWLVAQLRQADDPDRVRVVTADRRLAGRVRHHGGRVVSPGEFLARCGPPAPQRRPVR